MRARTDDSIGSLAATLIVLGLGCLAVAPSAALADASSMRLITLGTQGGPMTATRAQPANLLIVNHTNYLIDAGNGVARQLALAHVPIASIGKIFITHNHDDHNADWGTLMGLEWSGGRSEPIDVYGPRGTESMLLGFEQYFAPNVADRTFLSLPRVPPSTVFRAHDIQQDGLIYQDENIKVTVAENCHLHFVPGEPGYGWQKSYAVRISTPQQSVVFSGDTGRCLDRLVSFAKGASVLVHEVLVAGARGAPVRLGKTLPIGHSSPSEVGELAEDAGVGEVILTHLLPGGDVLPDSAYSDGVKARFHGKVVVAHDLEEFSIDAH